MFLIIYVASSLNELIGYMFVAGMATSGRTTTGFVYTAEFLAPKWRVWYGTSFVATAALTGLWITMWFDYINKHYLYVASVGMVTTLIGSILTWLLVDESPLWQLKKGKVKEAQKTLRRMCHMNGVTTAEDDILTLEEILEADKQNSASQAALGATTKDFLRNPLIVRNLIIMGLMWCIVWFNYYIFKFQIKYLHGVIFHNFMADAIAQVIAIILAAWLYTRVKLKLAFLILLLISTAGGFLIIFFGEENPQFMPLLVGVSKFGVAGGFVLLLTSTMAMFPTAFAVQALGFMNFFARLFTGMCP